MILSDFTSLQRLTMLPNMMGVYFCVLCALGIISNASALTQTLVLQQASTVALGQTATYTCASSGSGPDPSFYWRVRQFPSRSVTQDLSSHATTPETDTDPTDGSAMSQISFVVTSSLLDNKEIWCSAVDSGSVTSEIYTRITPTIQPAGLWQSCTLDGTTPCEQSAFCDSATRLCQCSPGYYDDNGGTILGNCVLQSTLGGSCTNVVPNACAVTNSFCNTQSICTCISGYVQSGLFCLQDRTAGLGASCTNPDRTCAIANSACIGEICQCKTNYYQTGFSTCLFQSTVGSFCVTSTNASCSTSGSFCDPITGQCVCPQGYVYTTTPNSCNQPTLGQACIASVGCLASTVGTQAPQCINNVCQCSSNFFSFNNACYAKSTLGGSCTNVVPNACAATNSFCNTQSICTCISGYVQSGLFCLQDQTAGLGASCTNPDRTCAIANSACIGEICQCKTNYYQTGFSTCLFQSTVGSFCVTSTNASCSTSGSFCDPITGQCVCPQGYVYTTTPNSCNQPTLGQACIASVGCLASTVGTQAPQCINNVCQCSSNFFSFNNVCYAKSTMGSFCVTSTNASCSTSGSYCDPITGQCVCPQGFVYTTTSNSCNQPTLGQACIASVGCLASTVGTQAPQCINNVCQCSSNFFSFNNVCYAKVNVGASCNNQVLNSCSDSNSHCSSNGVCTCNTGFQVNAQYACVFVTGSNYCTADKLTAATTTGTTNPVTPDVTVNRQCYEVQLYDTVTLNCGDTKQAGPLRDAGWATYPGNTSVVRSTGRFINGDFTNPSLTISNVQTIDDGFYVCYLCYEANQGRCTASPPVEVQVKGTVISSVAVSVSANTPLAGETVTFSCTTFPAGVATSYEWLRNGVSVKTTASFTVLTIQAADSGTYICVAANEFGMQVSGNQLSVNVQYAPTFSLPGGGNTQNVFGNLVTSPITVTCSMDGNPAITLYRFYDSQNNLLAVSSQNTFQITSTNNGYGTYSCTAQNPIGTSTRLNFNVQLQQVAPQTLVLQQSSTVALGQTATYICDVSGSGPDPSFYWRVRQFPSRTVTQDLSSQATTPETDTDPTDGSAKSQISFVVTSSLLDNKEIWCSVVDSGSVTTEIHTSITPTIQPAGLGQSCTLDGTRPCKQAAFCDSTTRLCQCSPGYYDDNGGTILGNCVIQSTLGGSCTNVVPNACAASNSFCNTQSICTCISGYVQSGLFCLQDQTAGLGAACINPDRTCAIPNSACIGGICQCPTNYYQTGFSTCNLQSTVGSICVTTTNSSCSTTGSYCNPVTSRCICPQGYIYTTTSNSCNQPILGQVCTSDVGCLANTLGTTAPQCINDVCQCSSDFFSFNNICIAKASVGASCNNQVLNSCSDSNSQCSSNGVCACNTGFQVNSQNACVFVTGSTNCTADKQTAATTTGTTNPVTPDVTVNRQCYEVQLYGTVTLTCGDTKQASPLRDAGWATYPGNTSVVRSTGRFINGDFTNPSLTISNAQIIDDGFYVCYLCYEASQGRCTTGPPVEVQVNGTVISSVAVSVSTNTPRAGESVTFSCTTLPAGVATSYEWLRNGVRVRTTSSFTLSTIQTADSGTYVCSAANEFGSQVSGNQLSVDVQYAPIFSLPDSGDTQNIFGNLVTRPITVTCSMDGNPAITLYRFYDSQNNLLAVSSRNTFQVTSTNNGYGTYSCTAQNSIGTSTRLNFNVQLQQVAPSTAASTEDDGVSTGTIIASVVGIIFFILLLILIIICCCSYGWCRKKEKVRVEPTIVEQPKVRPYIPSIASEEPNSEPMSSSDRYHLKPAKDSGPIISMYDNSYETPHAHQLPALDTQYLYTDEEPRKRHKKRRKKTRRSYQEEPVIQETPRQEPDLVVVPGGRDNPNYFE